MALQLHTTWLSFGNQNLSSCVSCGDQCKYKEYRHVPKELSRLTIRFCSHTNQQACQYWLPHFNRHSAKQCSSWCYHLPTPAKDCQLVMHNVNQILAGQIVIACQHLSSHNKSTVLAQCWFKLGYQRDKIKDWVWGIQHWHESPSLALSQNLCRVHSTIISSILLNNQSTSSTKSFIWDTQQEFTSTEV